ncbi:MAG: TIGR00269 family protein [Nitrospinae bacterium]|nr:TIGR00269 family protein [Nitrospinota bacterium]
MKCVKCRDKALVHIRRHNSAFCRACFLEYFTNQVARAIKEERMFTQHDRVLVAVSGGKDSLALWDVLIDLGYETAGLHIHQGIFDYSAASFEKTTRYAEGRGVKLITVDLAAEGDIEIPSVAGSTKRTECSACGLIKRHYFNKAAVEGGFTVLATGHNLDDEAARLLGNVLRWQSAYLAVQSPVLEATHPRLAKKVKPLYRLSEYETASYAFLRGIDYIIEECPFSHDAIQLQYKAVLNQLEHRSPGTKQSFVLGFQREGRRAFAETTEVHLKECPSCGYPTTGDVCGFCRLQQEVQKVKSGARR